MLFRNNNYIFTIILSAMKGIGSDARPPPPPRLIWHALIRWKRTRERARARHITRTEEHATIRSTFRCGGHVTAFWGQRTLIYSCSRII